MNRARKERLWLSLFCTAPNRPIFYVSTKLLTDLKSAKPLASHTLVCYSRADPVVE